MDGCEYGRRDVLYGVLALNQRRLPTSFAVLRPPHGVGVDTRWAAVCGCSQVLTLAAEASEALRKTDEEGLQSRSRGQSFTTFTPHPIAWALMMLKIDLQNRLLSWMLSSGDRAQMVWSWAKVRPCGWASPKDNVGLPDPVQCWDLAHVLVVPGPDVLNRRNAVLAASTKARASGSCL